MRRVVAAIGLVVVLAAVGYTLLPFARQGPHSTSAGSIGYGASGFQQGAPPPCENSWQHGGACGVDGGNRRTAALAVGGTATVWAAIMVLILPRRRKDSRHPIFSVPNGATDLDQRIAA